MGTQLLACLQNLRAQSPGDRTSNYLELARLRYHECFHSLDKSACIVTCTRHSIQWRQHEHVCEIMQNRKMVSPSPPSQNKLPTSSFPQGVGKVKHKQKEREEEGSAHRPMFLDSDDEWGPKWKPQRRKSRSPVPKAKGPEATPKAKGPGATPKAKGPEATPKPKEPEPKSKARPRVRPIPEQIPECPPPSEGHPPSTPITPAHPPSTPVESPTAEEIQNKTAVERKRRGIQVHQRGPKRNAG